MKLPKPYKFHLLLGPNKSQGWCTACNDNSSRECPEASILSCSQRPEAKDTLSPFCPHPL